MLFQFQYGAVCICLIGIHGDIVMCYQTREWETKVINLQKCPPSLISPILDYSASRHSTNLDHIEHPALLQDIKNIFIIWVFSLLIYFLTCYSATSNLEKNTKTVQHQGTKFQIEMTKINKKNMTLLMLKGTLKLHSISISFLYSS